MEKTTQMRFFLHREPIKRAAPLLAALLMILAGSLAAAGELRVNDVTLTAALNSVLLAPQETLILRYSSRDLDPLIQVRAPDGVLVATGTLTWLYQPPADRRSTVIEVQDGPQLQRLKVFIGTPFNASTRIGDYRLGRYPSAETAPRALLKVYQSQAEDEVSVHYHIRDLVSRQPAGWPRYLTFDTALLEQLELIHRVLVSYGWAGKKLTILSAYRTPDHNARVGGAVHSRHIYGDAADLIADADGDGRMDDLNDDGETDRADVDWLIARLQRAGIPIAVGGVGSYETEGQAGAFLHIDARGNAADWED